MVEKCLLDTDILIYYFRQNNNVSKHINVYLQQHPQLSISNITHYEFLRGLQFTNNVRRLSKFQQFIDENEIITLNKSAIVLAAGIYAHLRRRGELINDADILIAGIALANNLVLITNNTSHFARIPNLKIRNWLSD